MTRRAWAFDGAVAAFVLVLGQLEAWYGVNATHRQGPHWVQALLYGVTALLLVLRRQRPFTVLVVILACYLVEFLAVGSPEGNGVLMAPAVAFYTAGRWEPHRGRALVALALVPVFGLAWVVLDPVDGTVTEHLLAMMWVSPAVIAWLAGALVRSQVEGRRDRASRAVAEERNRIARELHDVIGHSVSVMTVQASAVRRRLTPEQDVERQALETVESVGREALAEMRRMVGVLRSDDDGTDREPPPGLAELGRLVEKFRTAGLPVELRVTGEPLPLAPGLDLTAYRLVQEGLTNTLRHAVAPARAEVTITYDADRLELAVRDDGAAVTAVHDAGHGLLGMRERVAVYGGSLLAGPRTEGGFELAATLPLDRP